MWWVMIELNAWKKCPLFYGNDLILEAGDLKMGTCFFY
ncbi:hypothetical protein SAMD00020551_0939 [Mesobacillus selenatarsenatis SF-1]|uniref:Uncharacterized protein n=1 Tax=Mesobacillus selenatarsenatis (strain DSM 18680 / JCM 14380 / FERM P-15431 / SF-1) TaxID=1321606 RepID=A0A0A8X0Q0_MESS1|nr:hypothetical protein SAMD00020551_0939 [Mesobacillus selenatarsenatis SF-1]